MMAFLTLMAFAVLFGYGFFIRFTMKGIEMNDPSFEAIYQPEVSVVIPFRNEANNLEPLLFSLKSQLYSKANFDVVLVNDHSIDESVDIIKEFIENNPEMRLSLVHSQGFGKSLP